MTIRPPAPPSVGPSIVPGCKHKYEILEYPGVKTSGYLFYCVFCLDFQEKHYEKDED